MEVVLTWTSCCITRITMNPIMLPIIGHVHREHVGEQTGCQPRQAADDRLTTASGGLDT